VGTRYIGGSKERLQNFSLKDGGRPPGEEGKEKKNRVRVCRINGPKCMAYTRGTSKGEGSLGEIWNRIKRKFHLTENANPRFQDSLKFLKGHQGE